MDTLRIAAISSGGRAWRKESWIMSRSRGERPSKACESDISFSRSIKESEASASSDAREDAATNQQPDQAAESAQQHPDATEENRSHLAEIGKGIVLLALIALLVWMQYHWVYAPYNP